jgi:hypothetical protein
MDCRRSRQAGSALKDANKEKGAPGNRKRPSWMKRSLTYFFFFGSVPKAEEWVWVASLRMDFTSAA